MTDEDVFKFEYDLPVEAGSKSICVIIDDKMDSKKEFIQAIYDGVKTPFQGSYNWDALYDVLCSMEWLADKKIVVRHLVLPALTGSDPKQYVNVLADAVRHWRLDKRHELLIVFQARNKDHILQLLEA